MTCKIKVTRVKYDLQIESHLEFNMKAATLLIVTLGFLAPISGQAANYPNKALGACASAITEFHPEVSGEKRVVKRRSGSRGRYEYWINAGSEGDVLETRIYCRASNREGVIALAVQSGQWASVYPRLENDSSNSTRVAIVEGN